MWLGTQQNRSISLTAITSPLIYSSHHHVHKPETQQPSVRFCILKASQHNTRCLIFINTLDGSYPAVETTTSQNTALQYSAGTPAVETHLQKQNRSHSHSHLRPIYIGQIAYSPKVMECGRKPEDLERAQADTGRMCTVHTPWPQGGWNPGPSCC